MRRLLVLLVGACALVSFLGCQSAPGKHASGCSHTKDCLDRMSRGYCDCNNHNPLDPYGRCGGVPKPIVAHSAPAPHAGVPVTGTPLVGTPLPTGAPIMLTPMIGAPGKEK